MMRASLNPSECPRCHRSAHFSYATESEAAKATPICWGESEFDCPGWNSMNNDDKTNVFTASTQPATEYVVTLDVAGRTESTTIRNPKNRAIHADCCGFRRCARNLLVQVYYDMHRFTCVPGKGCRETMTK